MVHGRVSILLLCGLFFGCERESKEGFPDLIEVTAISTLTDPMEGPYPGGASVCLCRNQKGEKILVALPAFKDRKILSDYREIKIGSILKTRLIPWQERPAAARAMHFANDFRDEFDLMLFYSESFSVEKRLEIRSLCGNVPRFAQAIIRFQYSYGKVIHSRPFTRRQTCSDACRFQRPSRKRGDHG